MPRLALLDAANRILEATEAQLKRSLGARNEEADQLPRGDRRSRPLFGFNQLRNGSVSLRRLNRPSSVSTCCSQEPVLFQLLEAVWLANELIACRVRAQVAERRGDIAVDQGVVVFTQIQEYECVAATAEMHVLRQAIVCRHRPDIRRW